MDAKIPAAILALDETDPLAYCREQFSLPPELIYLDGNSLGALPRRTARRLQEVITQEWGHDLITSWNQHHWLEAPLRVGDKIAQLIGAAPGEVLVADSTSINLFKLLSGALPLRPERRVIISETNNFPTNLYIAEGLVQLLDNGYKLKLVSIDELESNLDEQVALVMLTQVNYKTGRLLNMPEITKQVHHCGALILWDLAHSCGALPIDLTTCGVDLAVGCGYKYLNGGPGAPAFLYVAQALQSQIKSFLAGWLGHESPFSFDTNYHPALGIRRFLCGTPPILSLLALECGVDILLETDLALLREKSIALTELFLQLIEELPSNYGFTFVSPCDPTQRGSQVCLRHLQGYEIVQALIARGVVGDFRAPDILRFGFAPLYLRYQDVWHAVSILREIMDTQSWQQPEFQQRKTVT